MRVRACICIIVCVRARTRGARQEQRAVEKERLRQEKAATLAAARVALQQRKEAQQRLAMQRAKEKLERGVARENAQRYYRENNYGCAYNHLELIRAAEPIAVAAQNNFPIWPSRPLRRASIRTPRVAPHAAAF